MMYSVMMYLVVILLSMSDGPTDKVDDKELGRLQGKWQLIYIETFGFEYDRKDFHGELEITNDKAVTKIKLGKSSARVEYRLRLFPEKYPKEFDCEIAGYDEPIRGIYSLSGDVLKRCHAQPGEARPATFDGTSNILTIWKRVGDD